MKDFATERLPIRSSRLPSLLRCPLGAVLEMIREDESGAPAHTGSAVHMAARAFHTTAKKDIAAALKEMTAHLPEYPLADLGAAEEHFRHYAKDPRNAEAHVILCEEKVELRLPAPAGHSEEVYITGTLDQVREARGVLTLFDIKTGGSMEGEEMLAYACAQLCAYQLAASMKLGKTVRQAAIIRTRDYLKTDRSRRPKPGPVFWHASWTFEHARAVMEEVRRVVGQIRSGEVRLSPSAENCRYCPAGGIANCVSRRTSLKLVS